MTVARPSDSVVEMTIDKRARAIRARREHLGMTKAGLAKRAGVDRGKLQRFEDGEDQPTDRWIGGIERALDLFEAETGHEQGEGATEGGVEKPNVMRVEVQGVYGAKALVFEAPIENIAELEAMVDRIMRRLAGEQNGPEGV